MSQQQSNPPIEIAPGWTIDDWNRCKVQLDPSGKWTDKWKEPIEKIRSRFQTRFLEPAQNLEKLSYSGFALLALDCLLLESLQAFMSGQHAPDSAASRQAFKDFLSKTDPFDRFFPDDNSVEDFYVYVRIGLLHDGETRSGWRIKRGNQYTLVDRSSPNSPIVNRDKFHRALDNVFRNHFDKLEQPNEDTLRKRLFDAIEGLCERSLPGWRPPRKKRK